MQDELIRVLGLDFIRGERLGREVIQVKGDNNVGAAADRGRKDMTVVRVGQLYARD
jgi:hypothetical protein